MNAVRAEFVSKPRANRDGVLQPSRSSWSLPTSELEQAYSQAALITGPL